MERTPILAAMALVLSTATGSSAVPPTPPARRPAYPPTRIVGTVDTYQGTKVADPFRWLERLDTPETWAWVEAQNKLTAMTLDQIPGRDAIRDRLSALSSIERTTTPIPRGERLFFARNDGLQPHDLLLVQDGPASEPRVLIDPAAFSTDGTVSFSGYSVSHDGGLVAYALSNEGSDWQDWHVREVATGRTGTTGSSGRGSTPRLGSRTGRGSSTPATARRRPARRRWRAATRPKCASTASGRRSRPTSWSTNAPTGRTGDFGRR